MNKKDEHVKKHVKIFIKKFWCEQKIVDVKKKLSMCTKNTINFQRKFPLPRDFVNVIEI